jgi:hypothetical protein
VRYLRVILIPQLQFKLAVILCLGLDSKRIRLVQSTSGLSLHLARSCCHTPRKVFLQAIHNLLVFKHEANQHTAL